jgi:hypothetical protein
VFLCCLTVQPLKSNWRSSPIKGSIEELSIRVWERGRQVGVCWNSRE